MGERKEKTVKVSSHGQRKQSIHEIQHLEKAKNLTLFCITTVNFQIRRDVVLLFDFGVFF